MSSIWGTNSFGQDVRIPVLGVTGPYLSGKSMFCLMIAPGKDERGPRTRAYDIEKSITGYAGLGAEIIDVPDEMRKLYIDKNGAPVQFKPIDTFRWWMKDIQSIRPGRYDVISVDPVTDLESGMVEWVLSRHAEFGFQSKDKFESTGGIFWNIVREEWKRILIDLASRCQTFVYAAHEKVVWKGGKPTSEKAPKGKSTLMELTSLYLVLSRAPNLDGSAPVVPRCEKKLKDRLAFTGLDADMNPIVRPYLPPAWDNCNPQSIRNFIAKPADYGHLAPDQLAVQRRMSDEERLQLEAQIAQDKREASENVLRELEKQVEMTRLASEMEARRASVVDQAALHQASQESVREANRRAEEERARLAEEARRLEANVVGGGVAPAPVSEASVGGISLESPPDTASRHEQAAGKVQNEIILQCLELSRELGLHAKAFGDGVSRYSEGRTTNPADLRPEEGEAMLAGLQRAVAKKRGQAG